MNKYATIKYVEVLFGNTPAKKLYEKFGFEVVEILSGKMPGNEKYNIKVYSMEIKMTRVVLITGASTGLGAEFAYKYAKEGYNLLLIARSEDKLLKLKMELEKTYNISVFVLVKDLTVRQSAKEVFEYTENNNLIVDILINNAGFGDFGKFADSNLEKQTNMIELNIITLVELSHYYLKEMIDRNNGKILNIASVASFMPGAMMSIYYATKAFVLSFTEAVSEELSKFNIKISALCPGPTSTGFEDNANVSFSSVKMSSAKEVVEYGYEKFMNTKDVVIIPGVNNKLLTFTAQIMPRKLVRKAVYLIQTNFRKN